MGHFSRAPRDYETGGPQFDFMVVDGKIAVIGFPMAAGKGNVGAVVLRRREAVEGVEFVFNALWRASESTLLFEGKKDRTIEEMSRLVERVRALTAAE